MPFTILFLGKADKLSLLNGFRNTYDNQQIRSAFQVEDARPLIEQEEPQVIIVDFDREDVHPLEIVEQLQEACPRCRMMGILQKASFSLAVKAARMGVDEVVHLSEEPHKLEEKLSEWFKDWEGQSRGEDLFQKQRHEYDFSRIIGNSPAMQNVLNMLTKIIRRKWVTVLIRGETGTGKELIARTIHYNCFDRYQPFVEVNCNALPENLLESELFGYEKGAFTDAKTRKPGLFELAQDGTLFLDEIGDISPKVQVKLLKVLEEKKLRRLGGTQDIRMNCRIITATNQDLQKAIEEGRFRNDLYYRLNVITITLPPLRERGDDVLLLARHFMAKYGAEYENPLEGITPEAEALLRAYPWPGNVRELKHTIERIVLLSEDKMLTREALEEAIESETPQIMTEKPASSGMQIEIPPGGISLEEGEKFLIEAILQKTNWNKRKTSQILKISRPRLDRKIEKFNLKP
ncbi:MAG: sigma-54-dependent Fis family transcriptional regulator [Calditrichaeota bacterium]|nr:MAG: sigma-54-dependent Fis family transcriptional regulator [Calditrichota bacterium]